MDVNDRNTWNKFLSGHWVLDMPSEEGIYPVRAKNTEMGWQTRVVYKDLTNKLKVAGGGWAGWFWSEPLPDLPCYTIHSKHLFR